MSKYIYRIIQKRNSEYYDVQRYRNSFMGFSYGWSTLSWGHTIEECEIYIKNAQDDEKKPKFVVVKEFYE